MTLDAAAPTPQPAKPVTAASRAAVEKSKTRRSEKFPVAFHYTISIPMNESLQRLTTGPAALLREVDIGRLALLLNRQRLGDDYQAEPIEQQGPLPEAVSDVLPDVPADEPPFRLGEANDVKICLDASVDL